MLLLRCLKRYPRAVTIDKYTLERSLGISGKPFSSVSDRRGPLVSRRLPPALTPYSSVRYNSGSATTSLVHSVFYDAPPVLLIQDLLLRVQETTGAPWWAAIALSVFSLRLLTTFPLSVYQQYILAKYENLQPEAKEISRLLVLELAQAVKERGLHERMAQRLFRANHKKEMRRLIVRDNCHPFKSVIVVFVQIPLWVSFSLGLRNLLQLLPHRDAAAQLVFYQLSVGGALWFSDLTHPDGSLLIPVLLGLVNLTLVEFQAIRVLGPPSKMQNLVSNGLRLFSLVMVPVAASVPSCLALYWLTSSVFGLLQNVVTSLPKARRFFRIPQSPSENQTPLRAVVRNIKKRLRIDN